MATSLLAAWILDWSSDLENINKNDIVYRMYNLDWSSDLENINKIDILSVT